MPIYDQTYREYDGKVKSGFRWWTIVEQELRVLAKTRMFIYLILLSSLHIILRILQIVTYDVLMSDPNNPITIALQSVSAIAVNEQMFFDFIRIQSSAVFLLTLFSGAGMICNDFQDNLMEIYFSKPLNWRDYTLGKVGTLILIGLTLTALPGVFFVVLHNALDPGMDTLKETYLYPVSIVLFSLAVVVPSALGVLASSALIKSQRFAGIAIFMILFGNMTLGNMLPELLRNEKYRVLAFPMAINRLGQELFHSRRIMFEEVHWFWPFAFVFAVCSFALLIVCRKVRRAEIAV